MSVAVMAWTGTLWTNLHPQSPDCDYDSVYRKHDCTCKVRGHLANLVSVFTGYSMPAVVS